MVSNGNKIEFENFVKKYKETFVKEDVYHLILKLKGIVMRNQLKRLSIAYTAIPYQKLIEKMGVQNDKDFDLISFLTKNRDFIENF